MFYEIKNKIGKGQMSNQEVVRECGTCTKCCEGHLASVINGKPMYPGNPCIILQIGKGCGDYENRPVQPCRTFECEWLVNPAVPEILKPEHSGVIITWQKINDMRFLKMTKAPNEPNTDATTWFIKYLLMNGINGAWDSDTKKYWVGSPEFMAMMNEEYLSDDQK